MNIYVFNPQYVKTSTLNYLCKIFKVKSVYNLIQDDYVDSYISNLNCEVAYNIRKTNFYNKDAAWKQGVYKFLDTIADRDKEIYEDVVDMKNSRWHPFYNIEHCGVINVMVFHNKHEPNFNEYLYELEIEEDFVAYARNILTKYNYKIADSIGRILVGLNINCFLLPIKGGSYRYTPLFNRYDERYYKWIRFLRKSTDGREFDPTLQFIVRSYRRDFLNDSKEKINFRDFFYELLTEEGIKARKQFQNSYEGHLEYMAQIEADEAEAQIEVEEWNYQLKCMRDEFNSEMNDHEAWPNID